MLLRMFWASLGLLFALRRLCFRCPIVKLPLMLCHHLFSCKLGRVRRGTAARRCHSGAIWRVLATSAHVTSITLFIVGVICCSHTDLRPEGFMDLLDVVLVPSIDVNVPACARREVCVRCRLMLVAWQHLVGDGSGQRPRSARALACRRVTAGNILRNERLPGFYTRARSGLSRGYFWRR